jgi:sulfite exporter TauE/SafE
MRRHGIDTDQRPSAPGRGIREPVYETLWQFAAWCGTPGAVGGSVAAGMLLAGAAASPLHCAPMCGGFVLGQVSDRMARLPSAHLSECQRLRAAALTPYHLGRITTYAALGLAAGGGGLAIRWIGGSAGWFMLLAAALLVLQATQRMPGRGASRLPVMTRFVGAIRRGAGVDQVIRTGRAATNKVISRGYPLGIALGFLPCGILYAALAAAAATGSPLYGAVAMACFGLGTVPALVVVGMFGAAAGHRFRRGMATLTPIVLLFNAGLLTLLGFRLLALS